MREYPHIRRPGSSRGAVPMKPFSLILALSLGALAAPAAADPHGAVAAPTPVDRDLPIEGALWSAVDEALRDLGRSVAPIGPGRFVDARTGDVAFSFECMALQSGARQCTGVVCWTDTGEGELPVSPGRPEEGIVGLGYGEDEDGDGWYGPYSGVYVSPGGNCGCTVGVGVRWTVA
jgi:hypothetical protein